MDMKQFRNGSYKANPQVFKANLDIGGLVAIFPHIIRIIKIGRDVLTIQTIADSKAIKIDYECLSYATDSLDNVIQQPKLEYVRAKFLENEFEDQLVGALVYVLAYACYCFWQPDNIPPQEMPLIQKGNVIIPRPKIWQTVSWGNALDGLSNMHRSYYWNLFNVAKVHGCPFVSCSKTDFDVITLDYDFDPWINPGISIKDGFDEYKIYLDFESLRDMRKSRIGLIQQLFVQKQEEAWEHQSLEIPPVHRNGLTMQMTVPSLKIKQVLRSTEKIFKVLA